MFLQQLGCILAGCSVATTDQPGIPESVRESWLALLHYRQRNGDWVSEIAQPSFFLASEGRLDPAAEWTADSMAFLLPLEGAADSSHAQCRFPARYALMKSALGWTDATSPTVRCAELTIYSKTLSGKVVSVVFASYYVASPASAFGHVMLSLADSPSVALAGHSASFEANTSGLSTPEYVRRGLLGGLTASYQVAPLHERAGRYEREELRDLWLFPLQLPVDTVDQLVRHLWELRAVSYTYGFFNDNCAQKILALLHAVAPGYQLLPFSRAAVLPSEVVRRLVTRVGMVGQPLRRPSLLEEHERQVSALNPLEREQFRRMVRERLVFSEASVASLSAALSWSELKTPSRAFQRQSEVSEHPDVVWRRKLWHSLAESVDLNGPALPVASPTDSRSLLQSHRPARVTLRGGHRAGEGSVQGVELRWLLHDVDDSDVGYPPSASVSVAKVELTVDAAGGASIDEATVLRVERLGSVTTMRPQVAWRLELGGRRLRVNDESSFNVGLELNIGAGSGVERPYARVQWYALAGLRSGVTAIRAGSHFAPEALLSGGLLMRFGGDVRTHFTIDHVVSLRSRAESGSLVAVVLRRALARDWELETRIRRSASLSEATAGVVAFF